MSLTSERLERVPRNAGIDPIGKDEDRFTIIFSVEAGQRLRTLARQMELPVSVMLRQWALDRIGDEERRVRGRQGGEGEHSYRSLEAGEQALRRTCPRCGDTHLALVDPSTGASECRACGATFFVNTRPQHEREGER
jgi:ribosomal protein S27AE